MELQNSRIQMLKVLVPHVWSAGTVQGKRFHLLENIWPPVHPPSPFFQLQLYLNCKDPTACGHPACTSNPVSSPMTPIYGLPSSSLRRLQIACTRSQIAHKRQSTNGGDRPLSSWTALWRHACKESKGRLTEGCSLLVYQHTCWKCTICPPTS